MPFLEGLQNNQSLESLSIKWLSTHPDQSLKKMGQSVAKSSLKQLNMTITLPWLQTAEEETIKDWAQSVRVGATDLIQSLECHQIQHFKLDMQCTIATFNNDILHQVTSPVVEALRAQVELVNSSRQAKGFLPITSADDQHENMFCIS